MILNNHDLENWITLGIEPSRAQQNYQNTAVLKQTIFRKQSRLSILKMFDWNITQLIKFGPPKVQ